MFENQSVDVLVIGGGVIGVCSAYYLRRQGREVTLLDKGEICSGCSYGNAGLVVPSHSVPLSAPGVVSKALKWMLNPESPFYIKPRLDLELLSWLWKFWMCSGESRVRKAMPLLRDLSRASMQLFEELAKFDGMQFGFKRKGLLLVYLTQEGFEGGVQEGQLLGEIGIEAKALRGAEMKELEPDLSTPACGGLYYPEDGHLIPAEFVKGLARMAETMGVTMRPRTEVLGFELSGGRISTVKTTRGHFQPREVVLACGSWSPAVARDLPIRLPIQAAKGYSVTVKKPERCPSVPLVLAEAKVGVTPMGEHLRFAGTLELAGLDLSVNQRRVDAIVKAVPRYLPELGRLELVEIWRGLRPCTPDGLPFLGRAAAVENLVVAAGHAMIGVSLGPVTGKLVSQVVCGENPMLDIGSLNVERFG